MSKNFSLTKILFDLSQLNGLSPLDQAKVKQVRKVLEGLVLPESEDDIEIQAMRILYNNHFIGRPQVEVKNLFSGMNKDPEKIESALGALIDQGLIDFSCGDRDGYYAITPTGIGLVETDPSLFKVKTAITPPIDQGQTPILALKNFEYQRSHTTFYSADGEKIPSDSITHKSLDLFQQVSDQLGKNLKTGATGFILKPSDIASQLGYKKNTFKVYYTQAMQGLNEEVKPFKTVYGQGIALTETGAAILNRTFAPR